MEAWKPWGQFGVGIVDLEWAAPGAEVSPNGVDPHQHLAARIFYPTQAKRTWWKPSLRGVPWLPGLAYAYGQ
jgi:hypothetical protein